MINQDRLGRPAAALLPGAVDPEPAAILCDPMPGHPACLNRRPSDVLARNPYVAAAVPSPASRIPHHLSARRRRLQFVARRRRLNRDDHARLGGHRARRRRRTSCLGTGGDQHRGDSGVTRFRVLLCHKIPPSAQTVRPQSAGQAARGYSGTAPLPGQDCDFLGNFTVGNFTVRNFTRAAGAGPRLSLR